MSMILAVPTLQSSIARAEAEQDPIFGVIARHKDAFLKLSQILYDDMIHCSSIDTTADPEPFGLITWRNFMIGMSEVDRTLATLIYRHPDEAEAIKSEVETVRAKCVEGSQRRQEWFDRNGITPFREQIFRDQEATFAVAEQLASVMPTTLAGVISLLSYIESFNNGKITIDIDGWKSDASFWPGEDEREAIVFDTGEPPSAASFPYRVMINVKNALEKLTAVPADARYVA